MQNLLKKPRQVVNIFFTFHQRILCDGCDVSEPKKTRKGIQHDCDHLVVVVFHGCEIEQTLDDQILHPIPTHDSIVAQILWFYVIHQRELHLVILLG